MSFTLLWASRLMQRSSGQHMNNPVAPSSVVPPWHPGVWQFPGARQRKLQIINEIIFAHDKDINQNVCIHVPEGHLNHHPVAHSSTAQCHFHWAALRFPSKSMTVSKLILASWNSFHFKNMQYLWDWEKKISCESQFCVRQRKYSAFEHMQPHQPPGRGFLIKNQPIFSPHQRKPRCEIPRSPSTPSLSFLTNSNTPALNPSRANLQQCTKCEFSRQKFPKKQSPSSP